MPEAAHFRRSFADAERLRLLASHASIADARFHHAAIFA
jgi:hypothetical protein